MRSKRFLLSREILLLSLSLEREIVVDFWFEDTLCRHYKVKNAKENLKKLWGKN